MLCWNAIDLENVHQWIYVQFKNENILMQAFLGDSSPSPNPFSARTSKSTDWPIKMCAHLWYVQLIITNVHSLFCIQAKLSQTFVNLISCLLCRWYFSKHVIMFSLVKSAESVFEYPYWGKLCLFVKLCFSHLKRSEYYALYLSK